MTREEAIEVIRDIYNYTKWDTYTTNEARTMAIKALEQEPSGDLISRQAVLDTISELNAISFYESQEDSKDCYYEIRNAIDNLPSVEQEPNVEELQKRSYLEGFHEALKIAVCCEDAISRQSVLEWIQQSLSKYGSTYTTDMLNMWGLFEEQIKTFPSVNPQEPKTGHWISLNTGKPSRLKDGMATESVKCSECDEWLTASDEYACYGRYCPNCGVKMVEPQESEG